MEFRELAGNIAACDSVPGIARHDHPRASQGNAQSVQGERLVQFLPGRRLPHLRESLPVNPGIQAFIPGQRLNVARQSLRLGLAGRLMVVLLQEEVLFEGSASLGQFIEVAVRGMNRQLLGMDLVDGDVHVHVIGIPVDDGDPLVLREAEPCAQFSLDPPQRLLRRLFPKPERHEQVIGLVRFRAAVAQLICEHFPRRHFGIVIVHAVCDENLSHTVIFPLRGGDVLNEAHDIAPVVPTHAKTFRDHRESSLKTAASRPRSGGLAMCQAGFTALLPPNHCRGRCRPVHGAWLPDGCRGRCPPAP